LSDLRAELERERAWRERAEQTLEGLEAERDAARAQGELLATVQRISRIALAELDADRLAEKVTPEATRAVRAQIGTLFLASPNTGGLGELVALFSSSTGSEAAVRSSGVTAPLPERLQRIADTRDASDELDLDWLPQTVPAARMTSYLGVPIASRSGKLLGAFVFAHEREGFFTTRDEHTIEAIAAQVAVAVENARLLKESQQAVRMRDEFLNIASHELKTPLTVLKGYAHLLSRRLQRGSIGTEEVMRAADELAGASERLDELVNDLLDTSRIRTDRLELRPDVVDAVKLASAVIERFRDADGRHELILDAPEAVTGVWDEGRLDQVLTNLVSNAVKYSPDGGQVTLRVRKADREATFEIGDEGIGIPSERLVDLFQPFSRVHTDRRVVDGTGLALYISQQIVIRHGGEILVESEVDKGSTFTVRLPLVLPASAVKPKVD
jgi:signal transduction histidine kinase